MKEKISIKTRLFEKNLTYWIKERVKWNQYFFSQRDTFLIKIIFKK